MDGYELAELLRVQNKTRGVPIIFISAVYSNEYHVFKGYEAGAVDFLVKPFNPAVLLSKISIFLQLANQKNLLEQANAKLKKTNQYLEGKVLERTAELNNSIDELKYENTERKQGEKLLRESNDRIRLLLDSTAEGIYGLDLQGNCTFVNLSSFRLLGLALG